MARLFTQEDIDRMKAMNKDMTGVEVGTLMLPREVEDLGYGPETEDPAPAVDAGQDAATAPVVTTPAVDAAPVAATAPVVTTPAADPTTSDPATLRQLLALQAPAPALTYENLSKTQRRMMAFAGLSDAGAALQGRKGTSIDNLMSRFNEQADMQRKATAAAQRTQLLGGLGTSRQAILGAAAAGFIDGPTAKLMIEELDRQKTQGTEISGKAALIARIDALVNDPNLEDALGFEGIVRGFASNVGLDPNVARVNEMIKQIRGDVFLQAFEKLKGGGQITELEGMKAEQAMARLGQMQGYDDYVNALKELRFYVDLFSRRMQGESIPDETIYTPGQDPSGGNSDPLNIL